MEYNSLTLFAPDNVTDYAGWLDLIAPADKHLPFTEARVVGSKGSSELVVALTPQGKGWRVRALVDRERPLVQPTPVEPPPVQQPPVQPPPVVVTEPIGTPTVTIEPPPHPPRRRAMINTAIWQRASDEQQPGVGAPFVFSGIGSTGPRAGEPDTAPCGVIEDDFYPGGGPNEAVVWHPGQRSWVELPSRAKCMADQWGLQTFRVCTVANAPGLSPATSAADTIRAIHDFEKAGVRSVVATWDLTGLNEQPWSHDATIDYWERVMQATAGNPMVVWNFTNEPITDLTSSDRWKQAARFWLAKAASYQHPHVILDLGVWGQDLNSLAKGALNRWRDEMVGLGLWAEHVCVGWHAYGANTAGGGYNYETMAEDLDTAQRDGWQIVVGEFGQTKVKLDRPKAGLDEYNRTAVDCLVTDRYGDPLAGAFDLEIAPWIASGDTTTETDFALTLGRRFDDKLSRPLWQITEQGVEQGLLTDFGHKFWDYTHG